jgi:hypothetical protein
MSPIIVSRRGRSCRSGVYRQDGQSPFHWFLFSVRPHSRCTARCDRDTVPLAVGLSRYNLDEPAHQERYNSKHKVSHYKSSAASVVCSGVRTMRELQCVHICFNDYTLCSMIQIEDVVDARCSASNNLLDTHKGNCFKARLAKTLTASLSSQPSKARRKPIIRYPWVMALVVAKPTAVPIFAVI